MMNGCGSSLPLLTSLLLTPPTHQASSSVLAWDKVADDHPERDRLPSHTLSSGCHDNGTRVFGGTGSDSNSDSSSADLDDVSGAVHG